MFLAFANINVIAQDAKNIHSSTTHFKVFGACEQCKARIELAVKIKGVKLGVWDEDTKMLTLEYDSTIVGLDKIKNKILLVGHDLEDQKAKDIIYKELPACCHYRELEEEEKAGVNVETIVKGVVLQDNTKGKFEPLSNASVFWLGTSIGSDRNLLVRF